MLILLSPHVFEPVFFYNFITKPEHQCSSLQAGQVYGVPLSGSLLTKPGVFPELRPCDEDLKKKWIEV